MARRFNDSVITSQDQYDAIQEERRNNPPPTAFQTGKRLLRSSAERLTALPRLGAKVAKGAFDMASTYKPAGFDDSVVRTPPQLNPVGDPQEMEQAMERGGSNFPVPRISPSLFEPGQGMRPDEPGARLEETQPIYGPPAPPMIYGEFMRSGQPETFGTMTRNRPMSVEEARAAGLIAEPGAGVDVNIVGRNPGGVNAGMGHSLDAVNRAEADATRGVRWGQGGPTRGPRYASVEAEYDRHGQRTGTVRTPGNPTGTQDRAQMILDTIRGREQRTFETGQEIRKAQGTPQASTGYGGTAVYTPGADGQRPGSWSQEERKTGAARPMTPVQAANLIKQAAGLRAGDKMKGVAPDSETADTIENLLREQGFDVETLREGGAKTEGGGQRTAGGADANTRVIRGVTYKLVNGVWKKQA